MAGYKVTMYKQYGKNVFEEKVVKVEVFWSEGAKVSGYEVTVHNKIWEEII